MEQGGHVDKPNLLESDDWQAVLDFVSIRATLGAQYVELVGYDPFADDPTISPQEVENTLRDVMAISALESAKIVMLEHLNNWHADEWEGVAMYAPYLEVCKALDVLHSAKVTA
jgi:hypothetical protein